MGEQKTLIETALFEPRAVKRNGNQKIGPKIAQKFVILQRVGQQLRQFRRSGAFLMIFEAMNRGAKRAFKMKCGAGGTKMRRFGAAKGANRGRISERVEGDAAMLAQRRANRAQKRGAVGAKQRAAPRAATRASRREKCVEKRAVKRAKLGVG